MLRKALTLEGHNKRKQNSNTLKDLKVVGRGSVGVEVDEEGRVGENGQNTLNACVKL